MEALIAVQVALLTIYDMGKAVDRSLGIPGVRLPEKLGNLVSVEPFFLLERFDLCRQMRRCFRSVVCPAPFSR